MSKLQRQSSIGNNGKVLVEGIFISYHIISYIHSHIKAPGGGGDKNHLHVFMVWACV